MKSEVAVLDANQAQRSDLRRLLQKHKWKAFAFGTFQDLESYIDDSDCHTVVINLDNISADNRTLRKLKMKRTLLHIIALSLQPYHPELEEAFREHISVCIANPVDPEELMYWLTTFDP